MSEYVRERKKVSEGVSESDYSYFEKDPSNDKFETTSDSSKIEWLTTDDHISFTSHLLSKTNDINVL
jgi:hypothetical protein